MILVELKLEVNPWNNDATAWFAYYSEKPSETDLIIAKSIVANYREKFPSLFTGGFPPVGIDPDKSHKPEDNNFPCPIWEHRYFLGQAA